MNIQQIENFAASAGDRVDPVAQALRRLFQRVELCPCRYGRAGQPKKEYCKQCEFDLQAIEEAWEVSEPKGFER